MIRRDRPKEECGVCAVAGHPEASRFVYLGLFALQHRGQETAGIVSAPDRPGAGALHLIHRGVGLVADVFDAENLERLQGDTAIGHVRYSTTGSPNPQNTQPVASTLRHGPVALGHNGNLTNARQIREELKQQGAIFQTSIDTEVIMHLISRGQGTFEDCLIHALTRIEGAYSLVILHGATLYVVRDPRGFRPLSIARLPNGGWVAASETVAFDIIEAEFVRDVAPGEVLRLEPAQEPVSLPGLPKAETTHCIFELVYFSRPDSMVDGASVQKVREQIGEELFREHPAEADVVIPVPDSSTASAIGYARASGLSFEIGLIRNHYIGRTFIEPQQRIRDFGAKVKYNPVRGVVSGRRVVVVDDSIIRGTTTLKIVRMLRAAGAREVHMRVASPPWRNPCLYGVDTPDPSTFVATGRDPEAIRQFLGVDSLGYVSEAGLRRAMHRQSGWCMACFDGNYPTGNVKLDKHMFEHEQLSHVTDREVSE